MSPGTLHRGTLNRGTLIRGTLRPFARVVLLVVAIPAAHCRNGDDVRPARWTPDPHTRVAAVAARQNALRTFSEGVLLKPARNGEANPLFDLAPLILHETSGSATNDLATPPSLGAVALRTDRAGQSEFVGVDGSRPSVYAARSSREIAGATWEQILFLWWYEKSSSGPSAAHGIRITLGEDGFPLVWEVSKSLAPGALDILFVSQTLESEAREAFGPALPERAFACAQRIESAPRTIVARILEDGPLPMGPYAYIARNQELTTLLCRCMPAQVDAIAESKNYALTPLAELGSWGEKAIDRAFPSDSLCRRLRWPPSLRRQEQ